MKRIETINLKKLCCFLLLLQFIVGCNQNNPSNSSNKSLAELVEKEGEEGEEDEKDGYDGPAMAMQFEFERTKDPSLGFVPTQRLVEAMATTMESKANFSNFVSAYGVWDERGPTADVVGSSNGNTRANSGVAAGRVRAVWVDRSDATGRTVWVGGVAGGLWKTTDITATPATWTLVADNLSNMAISYITQDPTNNNIMYFCTGEAFFNLDAVQGAGIFKSTDNGATWTQLSSTTGTNFAFCTKILCDYLGNIYVSTRTGLYRSNNGGTSWTTITPTGLSTARISDIEISSTTASGRLHVSAGIFSTQAYRYTDNPATATSASFVAPVTAYPSFSNRAEIAVSGNTLYACPADATDQVPTIYKSTDGGANWAATTGQPTAGWASGQGWYALSVRINPADANQVIVGGLDTYKTTDGGATWTKISAWVGTAGQYVHADVHDIIWYDNGNKLLFACDGGIHYSADGGTTIRDKNTGLRIKQFYSCAIHPSSTNYFLAGAQDNGTHQLSNAGLSTSVEVTGGDGAYTAIDQATPSFQMGAYVYNRYRRSTTSGASWGSVNFYKGTSSASFSDFGSFINPFVLDNSTKILYATGAAGTFFRWTNPQTQTGGSYYQSGAGWPATASEVNITALNSSTVTALHVSPYTADRLYLTTAAGRVVRVDGASTIASGSAGTNLSTGLPAANAACIATGTDDNNLMVCYTNYGINSIWVSNNGGTSWTSIEGNLPDMPVRWCMFGPGDNTKAIIATETGVWITQAINGASTVWLASPSFPTVRTDMLQYRPSDKTVLAATHGRGLWTQSAVTILPLNNFNLKGKWTSGLTDLNWNYENLPVGASFQVEQSTDGVTFNKIAVVQRSTASNYQYKFSPDNAINYFYRIKAIESNGNSKYSNVVRLFKNGATTNGISINRVYPNPAQSVVTFNYSTNEKGIATYTIAASNGATAIKKQEVVTAPGTYSYTETIASLRPGVYILTININGKIATSKIVKQ
ncbi:T9SS type A sorting domain-containing protein [Ferruginibacter yonginensis]|uniref:T9SS type A sorting domain-containing protein n=1 Tax=Ferruginibacter yonginensis TaxID=1310416 RepID=A0ABV8QSA3_9BACT